MKTLDAAEMLMQSVGIFYYWRTHLELEDLTKPKLEARFKSIINDPDKYYSNLLKLMNLLKIDDRNLEEIVESLKSFDENKWSNLEYLEDDIFDSYFNCELHDWKYPLGFDLSMLNHEDLYLDDPENAKWFEDYDPDDDYDPENDLDDDFPI